jgi:hypothetical protein
MTSTRKRNPKSRRVRKEYYEKVSQKKTINRWTENEYLQLVSLVRDHGENWERISHQFVNKTAKQCMQKFKNSARSAKKGNWTEEEDRILMDWIKTHGAVKWTECSKNIKGRCGKQCRERWVNILNPGVKKGNWTDQEQTLIFENLKKYFTSWSLMAKELEGRTENSIKNYFYSSIRRLKSNNIIHYLKEVYVPTPGLLSLNKDSFDYVLLLQHKLPFILENRDTMIHEITKLNCLSKLICMFMLDMDQIELLILQNSPLGLWKNNFEEQEKDFLKFLIEIVLELNSSGSGKNKKLSVRNVSKKGKPNHLNSCPFKIISVLGPNY